MGMIVPTDAADEGEAGKTLSLLKQVMTLTTMQHFAHLPKMKIVKSKFVLRAPEEGAVGPLFTGSFKMEYDVPAQPSAMPIVEGDAIQELKDAMSKATPVGDGGEVHCSEEMAKVIDPSFDPSDVEEIDEEESKD